MDVFGTEYVDYWREVYENERLYERRGILLETFLLMPQDILDAVAALPPNTPPLLPAQALAMHRQALREAAEQEELACEALPGHVVRDGRHMQVLHRRAWDISRDRDRRVRP